MVVHVGRFYAKHTEKEKTCTCIAAAQAMVLLQQPGDAIRMVLLPGQGAHIDEEGEGVVGGCGRCWRHSGSLVSRHSWSQIRRWDWSLNNGTLQA